MKKKKLIVKIRISSKRIYEINLTYLKENWGAPFIITFMILLIAAATYLAIGNEPIANKLAEYAYYSLVIGVILQLIVCIKYERSDAK